MFSRFHAFVLRRPLVILAVITLIGAVLRLYHLGFKALWYDEAVLYQIASGSTLDVLARNFVRNSAPPLFPLLVHFVMTFSQSEFALRLVSFISGVLAIPAMYLLARKFMSQIAAFLLVFVVAIAMTQVRYSQQLREYTLTFLLATLMLWAFTLYITTPSRRAGVLIAVTFSVGVFTQYGLALLIVALNLIYAIYLLTTAERKSLFMGWVLVQLPVVIAAIVVLEISLKGQWQPGGFGANRLLNYLPNAYWNGSFASLRELAVTNSQDLLSFTFESLIFRCLFLIGAVSLIRPWRFLAIGLLFVPLLLTFAAALVRLYPYLGDRQDMFLTPMIFIVAGIGIDYLLKIDVHRFAIAIFMIILVLGDIAAVRGYLADEGIENIRPIADKLAASYQPGDEIYVYYWAVPALSYYYRQNTDAWIIGALNQQYPEQYAQQIKSVIADKQRVWLVFSHCDTGDECTQLVNTVSQSRKTELVSKETDSMLYLVQ